MHTAMLLDDAYPPDIRVAKEAGSLLDDGHEVTLLCHREQDDPRREDVDGVDVVRRPLQHAHEGFGGLLDGARYLVTRVHRPWLSTIESVVRREGIDVLHAHDLPLVKTAIEAGDRQDLPVIADLHENWPEAKRQYRTVDSWSRYVTDRTYLMDRVTTPIWRLKRLERWCVRRVDRTIAVTEEGREHYVRDCGADPDDVTVVPNYVNADDFDPEHVSPGRDDEFTLTYVGTLGGEHRGLVPVIDALALLREDVPDARLVIVGSGDRYERVLRERASRNGVQDRVTFTGWVDFEEVPRHIATSDVCLVPHRSTPHTETTLPHKLFQYMSLGRPVLVTDVAPLARIVGEENAGVVVPSSDHRSMASALKHLAEDPALAAEMGANGRRAVERRYNWSTAGEALCEAYRELEESARVPVAP